MSFTLTSVGICTKWTAGRWSVTRFCLSPYLPGMEADLNTTYASRRGAVDEALQNGDHGQYVWLHERPYRLDALLYVAEQITDECLYWKLAGEIWSDSENISECFDAWRAVLSSDRPCRDSLMNDQEREYLAGLPPVIDVYRGFLTVGGEDDAVNGFSWTLDESRAEWFAQRFAFVDGEEDPVVATGRLAREKVLAYFSGRNEAEVVCLPADVEIVSIRYSVPG